MGRGDKFQEECGVVGVWNHPEAANLAYLSLYAQQHRGQEGAGVLAHDRDENRFTVHKGHGLVADVFQGFDFANRLSGKSAIGHVRYATAGSGALSNVHPLFAETAMGKFGVAHNGNLINTEELREELIDEGAIFGTSVDTEVILHLVAHAPKNLPRVPAPAPPARRSAASGLPVRPL